MTRFIGRAEELKTLRNIYGKQSASLIVLKGRRRIGKSRLLEEFSHQFEKSFTFSGLLPAKDSTAQMHRDEFAGQLADQINEFNIKKKDWSDLFRCLAKHVRTGRVLIVLDEISWMGAKDPTFLGKLKNAWDLYFKKNDQLILAICGSASAWIDKNILSNTGFLGRESLDLTLEELPLKDSLEFWNKEKDRTSPYEILKLLAVTGGVPRYLEHINPLLSSEENISQMCFNKNGILFNEFEKIFSDLFAPKNILYKNIVSCLADGITDQETICNKIGLKRSGDLSDYLNDLIKSGFISREFTWKLKNGKLSNLSHYRLKDNYSRFYLKYIEPYRTRIESGSMKDITLSNLKGWYSILGLQIENLILSNRHLIKDALQIDSTQIICDNPFFQRKTVRQSGCQIDYLIQTKHNVLYICEIKYSMREIGSEIIEEVNEKLNRLSIPHYFSFRPILIHVNGVSEAVEESQFFSKIICFSDFLK